MTSLLVAQTLSAYYPFQGGLGSSSAQSDWVRWIKNYLTDGVALGDTSGALVSQNGAGDRSVNVATGRLIAEGVFAEQGAGVLNFAVAANASGLARVDRVVAEWDWTLNLVRLGILQGTPGSGAPALTQNSPPGGNLFQVSLAQLALANGFTQVLTANITDERLPVTGVGAGLISQGGGVVPTGTTLTLPVIQAVRPGFYHVALQGAQNVSTISIPQNGGAGSSNLAAICTQLLITSNPSGTAYTGSLLTGGNLNLKGTWTPGAAGDFILLAALSNAGTLQWYEVTRSQPQTATSPWVAWTPTITQVGAVTFTTTYAKYAIQGSTAHVYAELAVTSAGTGNNPIVIGGLPAAIDPTLIATGNSCLGSCTINDISVGLYTGSVNVAGLNTIRFARDGSVAGFIGQDPNFALANGDVISFRASWPLA